MNPKETTIAYRRLINLARNKEYWKRADNTNKKKLGDMAVSWTFRHKAISIQQPTQGTTATEAVVGNRPIPVDIVHKCAFIGTMTRLFH